jgi:chaperone modulatory protein CbpM
MLLDEGLSITLSELCRATGLHAEALLGMVEEGVVDPCGASPSEWRFRADAIVRVNAALRLQRDLDLNLAGVALALDLLDEVRHLRGRVRALEALLDWPAGADNRQTGGEYR